MTMALHLRHPLRYEPSTDRYSHGLILNSTRILHNGHTYTVSRRSGFILEVDDNGKPAGHISVDPTSPEFTGDAFILL